MLENAYRVERHFQRGLDNAHLVREQNQAQWVKRLMCQVDTHTSQVWQSDYADRLLLVLS